MLRPQLKLHQRFLGRFMLFGLLGLLLAFLLPMLLLGLSLRKPLIGINAKMDGMLKSTKLM